MIDLGVVPEGFDWTEHADLSCAWEAQKALDLELNRTPTRYLNSAPLLRGGRDGE